MSTSRPSVDEIEQHRPAVTRYLRYLIRDAAEADDLAQETFIRAHRQRDTLRDPAALESWLYQIATHVSIDRMRQRTKVAERQVDETVDELPIADSAQPSSRGIAISQPIICLPKPLPVDNFFDHEHPPTTAPEIQYRRRA